MEISGEKGNQEDITIRELLRRFDEGEDVILQIAEEIQKPYRIFVRDSENFGDYFEVRELTKEETEALTADDRRKLEAGEIVPCKKEKAKKEDR